MATYLKYTGAGSLPGVPARDLTAQEAKQFDEEALLKSGCYVKVKPTPAEDKAAAGGAEDKDWRRGKEKR